MWKKRYGANPAETATNNSIEKRGRYFANKSEYEGIKFDSDAELKTYKKFVDFKAAGGIREVVAHPPSIELVPCAEITIHERNAKGQYKPKKRTLFNNMDFNPDFKIVLNSGKEIYWDHKCYSTTTDAYKIKVKLLYQLKGIICVTGYDGYINNLGIVIKLLDSGNFLQYFNKNSVNKYIKDALQGKFEI